MGLLHWCTLTPEGPSSLAAIRFAAPIRVSSIRVFPNGSRPFEQSPDVVARTEPEAFFVEVFFNAHPIPHPDSKEKQRVANALVPTIIAYAGGQVDFTVDMGTEYATRLMIVKGKFDALSMAIYGEVVLDAHPPIQEYESHSLPSVEPLPLSTAVDPSNSSDPTLLAKRLLDLIPDSPPLPLVVRLMFCLKPSDEDWDSPEFPYLHADLDSVNEGEIDLETAILFMSRPVRDDASYESLSRFAAQVTGCIDQRSIDRAYQVARLLSISASQHPDMARTLLQHIDISSVFDPQILDGATILHLLDAATNADIARYLSDDIFMEMLQDIQDNSRINESTQVAARRLSARIRQWHCFDDALSNTRGDFEQSANLLRDIGTEEQSMGIWLECMIIHEDIATKLTENAVLPPPHSQPPFLLRNNIGLVSHDAFVTFVRAYIGVASVLAVWAWADSLGNDACREQALAILHLWQGVDGYREIVNHLLLLRQLTRRLDWITADNDPPRKSGILAEKVLVDLAKDPGAILHNDLVQTILSLKPPLSFIAEHERLSMRKVALVAEDGLSAAVEELMFTSDHPLSLRRLRTLRVSLAIVERELADVRGELRIIQTFWEEQLYGIVPRLIELLIGVASDLDGHFTVSPPPQMNQPLADQLFRTANDLLRLIICLSPSLPLIARAMRDLTIAIADVFACTEAADMTYSQSSSACISAQATRQVCLDVARSLSALESYTEPGRPGAEVVLRALLEHAGDCRGRDPVYHLLQVFTMIDHILPESNDNDMASHWVTAVFPKILNEVKIFFRLLDTEYKVHFIKRLVRLDDGVIGMGEWLLLEELKHLSDVLDSLTGPVGVIDYRITLQHQVSITLHLLLELAVSTSSSSTWCLTALASTPDLSQTLSSCLGMLLDGHYTSPYLRQLVIILAASLSSFSPDVAFTILLATLRVAQEEPNIPKILDTILDTLKSLPMAVLSPESLRHEIGRTLLSFSQQTLTAETSQGILSLLTWLLEHENTKFTTLCNITPAAFSHLYDSLKSTLPIEDHPTLENLRSQITIDEDEEFYPSATELPPTLNLPIRAIVDLLRHDDPSTPSTPKGTKTPDILGLVISPPTALLRSPATTGLTKTYINNDFRQLRQAPSARQNTSRLPSMHGLSSQYLAISNAGARRSGP